MKKLKSLILGMSAVALVSACSSPDEEGPRIYHDVLVNDVEQLEFQPIRVEDGTFNQYAVSTSNGAVDVANFTDEGKPVHRAPVRAQNNRSPAYSDGSVDIYLPWAAEEAERTLRNSMEPVAVPVEAEPISFETYKPARRKSDKAAKVYFGHGAETPDARAQQLLSIFSDSIKGKEHPIEVTGYASSRADIKDQKEREIANLKTSLDRAFEVSKTLIRKGVPADTIKTSAWGESFPADATSTKSAEEASRRVEITSRHDQ
ncbi:MAG: OmpA family protein [Pseudomonadota bacterium]